jgi:spore germination cell wall hydrolase CwlJ-like protein
MEKILRLGIFVISFILVASMIQTVTKNKFIALADLQMTASTDVVSIRDREKQLDCLAINIYREAGHEPFEGKVAVGQVTMNRVVDGRFGKDVCGVVYQKNVVMERVICQFSWACDSVHRNRPINKPAYTESYEVAKKVLLEGFRLDIMKKAMYYHADYVNPNWKLEKIGKIGRHVFYKEPK